MSDPIAAAEREQALARINHLRSLAARAHSEYLRTGSNHARATSNESSNEIARLEARIQDL